MGCTGSKKSAAAVDVGPAEPASHGHDHLQPPAARRGQQVARSVSMWSLSDDCQDAKKPKPREPARAQRGKRSRVSPASSAHSGRSGYSSAGSWASPSRSPARRTAHSASSGSSADSGIDEHAPPAGHKGKGKGRGRVEGKAKARGKGARTQRVGTSVANYADTTLPCNAAAFQAEEGFGSASDSDDEATALDGEGSEHATCHTPPRRGSKGDVFGQSCGEVVLKGWDFAHAADRGAAGAGAATVITVSTHTGPHSAHGHACEVEVEVEDAEDADAARLRAPTVDLAFAMEGTEPTTDHHAQLHAAVLREDIASSRAKRRSSCEADEAYAAYEAGAGGGHAASRAQVRFASVVAGGGSKREGASSRARAQAPQITTDYSRPQTPGGLAFEITFEDTSPARPARAKPARLASLAKGPEWKRKHPDLTMAKLEKKLRAAELRRHQHTKGVVKKMTAEMTKLEAAKTLFMRERTSILQSVTQSEDKATQNRERHLTQLRDKLRAKEAKAKRVRENKALRAVAVADLGANSAGAATACAY